MGFDDIILVKNRSDIGAGTRGSDMGIDAMEIAAINAGSDFFNKVHFYLMGKKQEVEVKSFASEGIINPQNVGVSLSDECFNHLDKTGSLEWLKNKKQENKNPAIIKYLFETSFVSLFILLLSSNSVLMIRISSSAIGFSIIYISVSIS